MYNIDSFLYLYLLKEMKKIDLIIDSLGGGGAEKICIGLANFLVEKKYSVNIITIKSKETPYKIFLSDKVKVKTFDKKNILNSIIDIFIYVLRQDKNTIILSFSPVISCILNLYKLLTLKKIKIISRCINTLSEREKFQKKNLKQKIVNILIKFLYKESHIIIAQSNGMKDDLIDNLRIDEKKIIVINNPCDITQIKKMTLEEISKEEIEIFKKNTIINVGSLTPKKNQQFLIKLIKSLKEKGVEFNLVLLGEGNEKENLIKLAEKLEVREQIYFLGFQKNPYKYLEKANFFFLSSLVEGFPNVILDALACNKVIFSSDCKSGPGEILEGKSQKNCVVEAKYGYLMNVENLKEVNNEVLERLIEVFKDDSKIKSYELNGVKCLTKYKKENIYNKYKFILEEKND